MCPPAETNGHANGVNGTHANGTNGVKKDEFTGIKNAHKVHAHQSRPSRPVGDFLSNVANFKIIESTLREGEQFANAFFDTETKIKIAYVFDVFTLSRDDRV